MADLLDTLILLQTTRDRAVPLTVAVLLIVSGLLLLADQIRWRRTARKLRGRIHGHLAEGDPESPRYRTVVEVTLPDGSRALGRDDSASTSLAGREPGRPVEVLVRPEDFPTVRIHSTGRIQAGIALSAGGAVLSSILWTTRMEGALFVVVLAVQVALVLWYLLLARRHPDALDLSTADTAAELATACVDPEEIEEKRTRTARFNRVAAPLGALVALGLLGGSLRSAAGALELRAVGVETVGAVVQNEVQRPSPGGPYYRAVVSYRPGDGAAPVRFTDPFASSRPRWRVGESVPVRYDPARPARARIDAGPVSDLLPSVLLGLAGLLVLRMSVAAWRTTRWSNGGSRRRP